MDSCWQGGRRGYVWMHLDVRGGLMRMKRMFAFALRVVYLCLRRVGFETDRRGQRVSNFTSTEVPQGGRLRIQDDEDDGI